jgi:hypothetical protein
VDQPAGLKHHLSQRPPPAGIASTQEQGRRRWLTGSWLFYYRQRAVAVAARPRRLAQRLAADATTGQFLTGLRYLLEGISERVTTSLGEGG